MVNKVMRGADIILLIGDARMPKESFNQEVFDKAQRNGIKVIYVLNKCDLIKDEEQTFTDPDIPYIIYTSAIKHMSTLRLYKKIREFSKGKDAVVGVVGYPNTGKSSVINALKGRKSAPTSSQAGFTRGVQKIRVSRGIVLLDTPGVIPYKERDFSKHAIIAAKDPYHLRDPENVVFDLMEKEPGIVEKHYKVEVSEDNNYEEILEKIAMKNNLFLKGRKPDTKRAALIILSDWQKGRLVR